MKEKPDSPFICPIASCQKAYASQHRLHEHFRHDLSSGHGLVATLIDSEHCFICLKPITRLIHGTLFFDFPAFSSSGRRRLARFLASAWASRGISSKCRPICMGAGRRRQKARNSHAGMVANAA
jgi:hypothetical protein